MTKDINTALKPYEQEKYNAVGITNAKLAAVALYQLEENEIDKTFENVVVAFQRLFPGKFSLTTYPDIPDTIRVDNTLRLDAGKGHAEYLTGNRVKGYRLTTSGRLVADEESTSPDVSTVEEEELSALMGEKEDYKAEDEQSEEEWEE